MRSQKQTLIFRILQVLRYLNHLVPIYSVDDDYRVSDTESSSSDSFISETEQELSIFASEKMKPATSNVEISSKAESPKIPVRESTPEQKPNTKANYSIPNDLEVELDNLKKREIKTVQRTADVSSAMTDDIKVQQLCSNLAPS